MTLVEEAHDIFNRAVDQYQPRAIFLMTSGGNDSVVPMHLFKDDPRITAAVHIDTGIKVPDVEPHVERLCAAWGLPLLIYRAAEHHRPDGTPDPQIYDDFVREHGFPGPAQHTRMYNRLKERQIRRLVAEHKVEHKDKIMLITGVRRSESMRRMGYVEETQVEYARVWVAPVANWDDAAMRVYREHHSIPKNPASEKLGMSGECLCGAFAKPGELARLDQHYPDVAARIRQLEADSGCPWGWEGAPDRQWIEMTRGQGSLGFTPLCASCVTKGRNK